jgi:hypothetical protein
MWGKRKFTQGSGKEKKEREHLEDLGVEKDNINMGLKEIG